MTTFLPSGQFSSLADNNGNTLTATYTSGHLSAVTDSAGGTYAITLSAQGRITTVTEPTGQVIDYAYDPTGTYLTSMSTDGQTTSFAYITNSTPQQDNAVASVTLPDGVTESFTYDSQGRLIGTSENGGALPETLSYDLGEVTVTDALGDTSTVWLNQLGQMRSPRMRWVISAHLRTTLRASSSPRRAPTAARAPRATMPPAMPVQVQAPWAARRRQPSAARSIP